MSKEFISSVALLSVLLLLSVHFYQDTINQLPKFIHAWTQSDRYAIALAFIEHDMNIFMPRTFNLITREGITAVDFPWPEYLVACLMKITGSREPFIFRGFLLLCSIIGCFHVYRIARLIGVTFFLSASLSVFYFTLPVLVYYQAGFIPSVPALSALFIGYYYFLLYHNNRNSIYFNLCIFFVALAALCRSPFNIFLFAIALHQAWYWYKNKGIIQSEIVALMLAYSAVFSWAFYKNYLSHKYGSMFLTQIVPASNLKNLWIAIRTASEQWGFHYFTNAHYVLLVLSGIYLVYNLIRNSQRSQVQKALHIQVFLTVSGAIVYFVLMANQFMAHD